LKNSVQLGSFVEERCFAGVEVFRSGSVDIAEVGMPSTNESENLSVVDDREDDPVAEAVDEPAGACHSGDTGDDHFVVGDAMLPEVGDEVGPAGGCLAGLESPVVGDVLAEPVGEIVLSPRPREVAAEIGRGELVDLEHAFSADRAFPPGDSPGEHAGDVGIALLGRSGDVAKHRRHRQVRFEPAFVHLPLSDIDSGGRRDGLLERGSWCVLVACRRIGAGQVI
jgi:hypothetical protein